LIISDDRLATLNDKLVVERVPVVNQKVGCTKDAIKVFREGAVI
jgi:hypothetical protein